MGDNFPLNFFKMTLTELSYLCWELLRKGSIVDDERLDIRMLQDWIHLKRAEYIRNTLSKNPNNRISLNMYQSLSVPVSVAGVEDAGDYPYSNSTTQLYEIVSSDSTIPRILEGKSGPLILSLESEDLMKLPFSVVDFDYLRFAGKGRFNSNIIFGSIRDNKVYFKYHPFFDTYQTVVLRAVFENPSDVTGFDADTTDYPVDAPLMEYIKNGILDVEIKNFLRGETDEASDSSGEIVK